MTMTVFVLNCPREKSTENFPLSPFFARLFINRKKVLSQINIHWHVSEILKKKKLPGNDNQLYQHRLI